MSNIWIHLMNAFQFAFTSTLQLKVQEISKYICWRTFFVFPRLFWSEKSGWWTTGEVPFIFLRAVGQLRDSCPVRRPTCDFLRSRKTGKSSDYWWRVRPTRRGLSLLLVLHQERVGKITRENILRLGLSKKLRPNDSWLDHSSLKRFSRTQKS